jgi:Tol biopolymer transport system component
MKHHALMLTVLIGLLTPTGLSGALFQDSSGEIVFYPDRDGNTEIYVMNADGSDQQRLTFNDFANYRVHPC